MVFKQLDDDSRVGCRLRLSGTLGHATSNTFARLVVGLVNRKTRPTIPRARNSTTPGPFLSIKRARRAPTRRRRPACAAAASTASTRWRVRRERTAPLAILSQASAQAPGTGQTHAHTHNPSTENTFIQAGCGPRTLVRADDGGEHPSPSRLENARSKKAASRARGGLQFPHVRKSAA